MQLYHELKPSSVVDSVFGYSNITARKGLNYAKNHWCQ